MSEYELVRIVSLVGFLILAISAFASFRMSWRKSLQLVLVWAVIITGLMLLITMIQQPPA